MGDMLSQAEIDALLNGPSEEIGANVLSNEEIDALGEIGNISMGTSATTLFTLLGQKVTITTPKVEETTWQEMAAKYPTPYVAIRVEYKEGLMGSNLLILKEDDVKIITDLMMGGDGTIKNEELSDLHLSAISEAMNQMIGSSATSMSSIFKQKIDISPPESFIMHFVEDEPYFGNDMGQKLVKIAFKMVIGDLIDSEIMQLIPLDFAKSMVINLFNSSNNEVAASAPIDTKNTETVHTSAPQQEVSNVQAKPAAVEYVQQDPQYYNNDIQMEYHEPRVQSNVNVQPAHFQSFEDSTITIEKKNINLIMDVPLEVTVELGRTNKFIKEILELGQGSIIELDKLAGDPVDVLVNGKCIAKGEVVVIDESFGVRILDILNPSKRL